ncbi:MAG: saccharopine dehydrogenase [Myxococcota bacterium]
MAARVAPGVVRRAAAGRRFKSDPMTAGAGGSVLLIGGYGVVGSWIARLLRERHPELPLLLAGRSPEKGATLAEELGTAGTVRVDAGAGNPLSALSKPPALVLTAANDPEDRVLLAAVRAGIPVVDITRWTARVQRSVLRLSCEEIRAPVVLASSWMGGLASITASAGAARIAPVERIEIDICYAQADQSGSDSVAYVDRLAIPFETTQDGRERLSYPLTDGRVVRFPGGRKASTYRLDTPEQATLPCFLGASTVATRIGYDSPAASWMLVALKRSGILRVLQRDRFTPWRRALLHSSGDGDRATFVVSVEGKSGSVRVEVVDPKGQAHLTAVGAVVAAERALGLDGGAPAAARAWFPEQFPDPEGALATAHTLGVEVVIQ